jgi:hypothetical protein
MRGSKAQSNKWLFSLSLALVLGLATVAPLRARAQSQGNNAVYSSASAVGGSAAYIDASASSTSSVTICATIYNILNGASYPTAGAVIDARGLNSGNSNLTCAASTSPWLIGGVYLSAKPARILLPAGTIIIKYPWIVPDYTKIVGVGSSSTSGAAGTTTLKADLGFTGGTTMIQMGDSNCNAGGSNPGVCFEISLSDLTLDANGLSIDGIDNSNAEELSYVQHAAILNAEGTGLFLSTNSVSQANGTASHSGPYIDLIIASGSAAGSGTSCVKIYNAQPRGIHGLTCSATSTTSPKAGIYLDGGNLSLEDIAVSGFTDGILIGAESPFNTVGLQDIYANLLSNITGATPMTNLIHICNWNLPAGNCPTTGFHGIQDIVMTSISGASGITNTIEDDLTSSAVTDVNVGLYALGEPVQGSGATVGYSRFTTAPSHSALTPTWFVGTSVNPNTASCGSVANGSLYSRGVSGGVGTTLFGCVSGSWTTIK